MSRDRPPTSTVSWIVKMLVIGTHFYIGASVETFHKVHVVPFADAGYNNHKIHCAANCGIYAEDIVHLVCPEDTNITVTVVQKMQNESWSRAGQECPQTGECQENITNDDFVLCHNTSYCFMDVCSDNHQVCIKKTPANMFEFNYTCIADMTTDPTTAQPGTYLPTTAHSSSKPQEQTTADSSTLTTTYQAASTTPPDVTCLDTVGCWLIIGGSIACLVIIVIVVVVIVIVIRKRKKLKDAGGCTVDDLRAGAGLNDNIDPDGDPTVLFDNEQYMTSDEIKSSKTPSAPRTLVQSSADGHVDPKLINGIIHSDPAVGSQRAENKYFPEAVNYVNVDEVEQIVSTGAVTSNRQTAPEPQYSDNGKGRRRRIQTLNRYELEVMVTEPAVCNSDVGADNAIEIEPDYDMIGADANVNETSAGNLNYVNIDLMVKVRGSQPISDVDMKRDIHNVQVSQSTQPKPKILPKPVIAVDDSNAGMKHTEGPLGDDYSVVTKNGKDNLSIGTKNHQKTFPHMTGPLGHEYTVVDKTTVRGQSVFKVV